MALNPKFTDLAVNTKADAQSALLNSGYLEIYDGTQPATADTTKGVAVNLATLVMNVAALILSVNIQTKIYAKSVFIKH